MYIGGDYEGGLNKTATYNSTSESPCQNLFIQNQCTLAHSQSSLDDALKPAYLYVGCNDGAGTYLLSGGKIDVLNDSYVGWNSDGVFTQTQSVSNTVHETRDLKVGFSSGKTGTYTLSAGTVDVLRDLYCGNSGTGRFNQTGGTCNVADDLIIGKNSGSDGKYSLNGATCNVADDVTIGKANGATGEFEITSGVLNVTGAVLIGTDSGISGSATLDVHGSSMALYVGETFHLGTRAHLEVSEDVTAKVIMVGSASMFHIDEGVDSDNLALNQLKLTFKTKDNSDRKRLEVAGKEDEGLPDSEDFKSDNFVLEELIVGKDGATGPVTLQLVDAEDNQDDDNDEALYVDTLTIKAGGTFARANGELWPIGQPDFDLYYENGGDPKKLWMGDANLDGEVNDSDLNILLSNYGNGSGMTWANGDFNGDRVVNDSDMSILLAYFGSGGDRGGDFPADLDDDGDIDIDDVRLYLKKKG